MIPYEQDFPLIGTTDLDYEGGPSKAHASAEEIGDLCRGTSERSVRPSTAHQMLAKAALPPQQQDAA